MSPGQHDQVCPPRGQNGIHVGVGGDVSHRHRRDTRLVANSVAERRLELAAVDRFGVGYGLPGRNIYHIGPVRREESSLAPPSWFTPAETDFSSRVPRRSRSRTSTSICRLTT